MAAATSFWLGFAPDAGGTAALKIPETTLATAGTIVVERGVATVVAGSLRFRARTTAAIVAHT
jgi:hypothetical protein